MGQRDFTLDERAVARLLKRIDGMVPAEQAEHKLISSSRRIAYGRVAIAILWVMAFSSLWAALYYNMLSEQSDSLEYILPRLSLSVGLMGTVVYMRLTERMKLSYALAAGVAIYVISRAIV